MRNVERAVLTWQRMQNWIDLPPELQARIFCQEAGLFLCGMLTCRWLHRCILRHATRLPAAIRSVALEQFVEVSRRGGFRRMSEDVMTDLVGDDALAAEEDAVLEAVVVWIKGGREERRGERLLGAIRYGLMAASSLREVVLKAEEMVGERQGACLRVLTAEALVVGQQLDAPRREWREDGQLCRSAFVRRTGIAWGDYAGGRRRHRLVRDEEDVIVLCGGGGHVFGGLRDGSVLVWDDSTLEERQIFRNEGQVGSVWCMTVCDHVVISGHGDGCLRAWNTETGSCDYVLRGHEGGVSCVALWEHYLVSGSADETVKVWRMGSATPWPCLGTTTVHTDEVNTVVVWRGRAISGSDDGTISVCNIEKWQNEATLDAHPEGVYALVVCEAAATLVSTGRAS